jgi:outer membrane protein OmpA-like peptidoglycan-associated protein
LAGSNTPYLAGISLCLLLGVGDLVLLNVWWAPQVWPPDSSGGAAVSAATVQPQPAAPDAAAAPVAAAPAAPDAAVPVAAAPVAPDAAAVSTPAAPVASPVAAATPVPATPTVTFETNRHILRPSSKSALAGLVAWLRKNPGQVISIDGHTDQRGDSLSNQALSLRRARAVAQFFWSRGVKRGQVHYRGHGATRPVDGRDQPAAWVKNRRVNIQIQRDGP